MPESTPTPKSESIIIDDLDEYPEGFLEIALAWIEVLLDGESYVGNPNNLKGFSRRQAPDEPGKHPRVYPKITQGRDTGKLSQRPG